MSSLIWLGWNSFFEEQTCHPQILRSEARSRTVMPPIAPSDIRDAIRPRSASRPRGDRRDLMAVWLRECVQRHVGNPRTEARMGAPIVIVSHPLLQHDPQMPLVDGELPACLKDT